MTSKWRITVPRVLPIAVSAAALVWLLRGVDLLAVAAAVNTRVVTVMLPALIAFCAVTLWIEAMSIHRLVASPPPSFGLWSAARIKCASYLPALLHYTLGLGGLAVLLRRRTGLSLGEALGLVLLISTTDLIVVLAAASSSAALLSVEPHVMRTGIVALVVVAFFGGIALVRSPGSLGVLERVRALSIFEGLRRVPLGRLGELLTLRVLFSACFVAGCASAFAAFDIPAPPARLIAGIMIVALVAALPIAVAGLGTSQAAFLYLFADIAPAERLLAMSLVLSFGIISLRAAMGLCFARELTREMLQGGRRSRPKSQGGRRSRPKSQGGRRSRPTRSPGLRLFTGERLHDDLPLFAVDLARHRAAYEFAAARFAGARVLDLGCGSGSGTALLARAGAHVLGVDRIAPDPESRRSRASFCRAEIAALPFRAHRFDAVVSFQVIEHLVDPAPYLRAIGELLADRGTALVSTPNRQLSDGVNPYHVREYLGPELHEVLVRHFAEVELLSVGMSEPVRAYLTARSRRIQRVMRLDPLRLRDRLPRAWVEALFALGARLVRRATARVDGCPDATWRDFPIGRGDDAASLDWLAVCRSPR